MTNPNCVNLDKFMEDFVQLEQKITDSNGRNAMLEVMLEDANRLLKFTLMKEKSLVEEKDSLLITVNKLQQTLQEQCNLRVKNERLKTELMEVKQQNERAVEVGEAAMLRLLSKMRVEEERHKRELETVRRQCSREVEDAHKEALTQLEAKDRDVKKLMEEKDLDLEKLKKKLKDQERDTQSELFKLQMEFGAKLARVQNTAQWSQQQQLHGSSLIPQSVYKRKLQFFQEEKNKEIEALRQRIKELEENQRASSLSDSRLKRRKI
ncbi:coiled-coil domain-containing protein 152-like [Melanotaenia boesemani]|uniref:coiled-coil domain-containing protein 152-like n=1 Tax=Melanotaenia boesemani TaxID=1250792 RepID=UPI001C05537A|nr:coiled-coil domain-containing protein 152-like [Melanotaenia boesemani]XP_041826416.1 coiled-coil domain-containing protein 152-like [Melanotaenia boesemani]